MKYELPTYESIVKSSRQAIDQLKRPNCDGTFDEYKELREAGITYHELIAEACEKQVAKKPIELPEEETFYDGGYHGNKCGICEIPVYDDQIYCDKCGVKIKWSVK